MRPFVVTLSVTLLAVIASPATATTSTAPPSWFAPMVQAITSPTGTPNPVFTVDGLWEAISSWDSANPSNSFMLSDNISLSQARLAAFLGNVAQETGGLVFATELAPPDYTSPCTIASGNCSSNYGIYFGRGALQVTCWGGSYCSAYGDVAAVYGITDMETNPDQVATNPKLAWGSAVVFYMTNTGVNSWGPAVKWLSKSSFGGTYATINGALECPPTNTQGVNDSRVANRIKNFYAACAAAELDCSAFVTSCPTSPQEGTCSLQNWPCQWDGDCIGGGGVCNIAANQGVCAAQTGWSCWADADCGLSGPCHLPATKGTCLTSSGTDCWRDSDCPNAQTQSCSLPNLSLCALNHSWGCRKDTDCGQSGPCMIGRQPTCSQQNWPCWSDIDCHGGGGTCGALPMTGTCNLQNWQCRNDADCGSNGPCWVNPGPTGVPTKPAASQTRSSSRAFYSRP
jgi:hypothetical protein